MKEGLKILLVEDDINLGDVISDFLELKNHQVVKCLNGEDAWKSFESSIFDICILDLMLPKMDGFSLLELIRKKDKNQAVIILTAKSLVDDKIKGFQLGADDYITKPFNLEELELRIQAVLKRGLANTKKEKSPAFLKIGDFKLDLRNRLLKINETENELTRKETELLKLLIENKNTVVSREMAFKVVWDKDFNADSGSRSLDVYIVKLRKYLSEDSSINIVNVHGSGYKLSVNR